MTWAHTERRYAVHPGVFILIRELEAPGGGAGRRRPRLFGPRAQDLLRRAQGGAAAARARGRRLLDYRAARRSVRHARPIAFCHARSRSWFALGLPAAGLVPRPRRRVRRRQRGPAQPPPRPASCRSAARPHPRGCARRARTRRPLVVGAERQENVACMSNPRRAAAL